jgi:stalled ribosome rescue protein Dom34
MSTGKYLSLEEARKKGLLKRFAKEHPSKGDEKLFDKLLDRMAKGKQKKPSR